MPVDESGGGGVKASELKGLFAEKELEKRDKDALFDKLNKIESGLTIIGNMICDSQGRCRLATKEEVARLRPAEEGLDGYSQQELWDLLKVREGAIPDLAKIFVKKMSEDSDLMQIAATDPEFQRQFLAGVCTTKECRERYNKIAEDYRKEHPEQKGEKEHFLVKKK